MTPLHLYVYYKVPPAEAAATLVPVRAMQAALVAGTSIRARLQRRADRASDDDETWMEIYPDAPDGFETRLAAAAAAAGVDAVCGPRHVERFEDFG